MLNKLQGAGKFRVQEAGARVQSAEGRGVQKCTECRRVQARVLRGGYGVQQNVGVDEGAVGWCVVQVCAGEGGCRVQECTGCRRVQGA
jgi:hypothetical protein